MKSDKAWKIYEEIMDYMTEKMKDLTEDEATKVLLACGAGISVAEKSCCDPSTVIKVSTELLAESIKRIQEGLKNPPHPEIPKDIEFKLPEEKK